MPMESIRAANAAVKYSVVNQANELGDFSAIAEQRTVHKGKRVVATSAALTYPSKIFFPSPTSGFWDSSGTSAGSAALCQICSDDMTLHETLKFITCNKI